MPRRLRLLPHRRGEGRFTFAPSHPIEVAALQQFAHAPGLDEEFTQLVMIFADSDGSVATEAPALRQEGIEVTLWAGTVCTEQQLFSDLPWQGVKELLALVLQDRDEQSIRNQVTARLPEGTVLDLTMPVAEWIDSATMRDVLGRTAGATGWYKQLHLGEAAGNVPPIVIAVPSIFRARE